MLAQPDIEAAMIGLRPFHTDARQLGLGAVPGPERGDGMLHPLRFVSSAL